MKRVERTTNGLWILNFLAAFGILLFAFLFLVFKPIPPASHFREKAEVRPHPTQSPGPPERKRFAAIWECNIGGTICPPKAKPRLSDRIEIAGTTMTADRKGSVAFINVLPGGDQHQIRERETVLGAMIVEIRSGSVVFDIGNGVLEEVRFARTSSMHKS